MARRNDMWCRMRVLIVESCERLGRIWEKHLEAQGCRVELVSRDADALAAIRFSKPDILVLSLGTGRANALALADFAAFQSPHSRVIFVSRDSFFSDGSIFSHAANACAFVGAGVAPSDLAELAQYHAARAALR